MRKAILLLLIGFSTLSFADISPEKIRTADGKKTQTYLRDGLVVGGDKAINDVVVRDIRRAANPAGFERIVIDLLGNRNGEPVAIPRPPYFQVAINADEHKVNVSVFGKPKLDFNPKTVLAAFKKSPVVERVTFYPVLEEDFWTFSLEMKEAHQVEVFELTNPVRVILDVKTSKVPPQAIKKTSVRPMQPAAASEVESAVEASEESE